ncbi:hypothetical protein [Cellulomonas rhizosphaerae]|nr:hypothetical protein [Cellulomonas rhizosphaerae]
MTTTAPAVDELAALDFQPELPCEANHHGDTHPFRHTATGPAEWWMRSTCPACGNVVTKPACEGRRQKVMGATLGACQQCDYTGPMSTFGFKFDPLRGGA